MLVRSRVKISLLLCKMVECNGKKVKFFNANGGGPSSYSLDRFNLVRKALPFASKR